MVKFITSLRDIFFSWTFHLLLIDSSRYHFLKFDFSLRQRIPVCKYILPLKHFQKHGTQQIYKETPFSSRSNNCQSFQITVRNLLTILNIPYMLYHMNNFFRNTIFKNLSLCLYAFDLGQLMVCSCSFVVYGRTPWRGCFCFSVFQSIFFFL